MNLASRGQRDMGDGAEAIEDEALALALKARSRSIVLKSLVLAAVLGAAVFFWPSP